MEFTWKDASVNLVKVSSEEDYVACKSGSEIAPRSDSGYLFACDSPGSHFFTTSIGTQCSDGVRVQIQVTQPEKTASIRSQYNPQTKKNHTSLAVVMETMISVVENGGFSSNEEADLVLEQVRCTQ